METDRSIAEGKHDCCCLIKEVNPLALRLIDDAPIRNGLDLHIRVLVKHYEFFQGSIPIGFIGIASTVTGALEVGLSVR